MSSSPKNNPMGKTSPCLGPIPHPTLSAVLEGLGQQQDKSSTNHWRESCSLSQPPHCHPSGMVLYHHRKRAEGTRVAESGWRGQCQGAILTAGWKGVGCKTRVSFLYEVLVPHFPVCVHWVGVVPRSQVFEDFNPIYSGFSCSLAWVLNQPHVVRGGFDFSLLLFHVPLSVLLVCNSDGFFLCRRVLEI